MVTATSNYKAAQAKAKEAIAQARSLVKDAFTQGAQEIFEQLGDEIKNFSWVQFTPYFNDGDTCYFSVRADDYYLRLNEGLDDEFDGEEYNRYSRERLSKAENWTQAEFDDFDAIVAKFDAVEEFVESFDEDDMLFMFGDHVRVVVSRTGTETEEYEHD